jgi:hypothetical protein
MQSLCTIATGSKQPACQGEKVLKLQWFSAGGGLVPAWSVPEAEHPVPRAEQGSETRHGNAPQNSGRVSGERLDGDVPPGQPGCFGAGSREAHTGLPAAYSTRSR